MIETSLTRHDYGRWSWEACSKFSGSFLLSPPDHFGLSEDHIFQVVVTTSLGQPCPLIAPVTGRYLIKKGQVLDRYGANLAAVSLPGQGYSALHNILQAILQPMIELGGSFFGEGGCQFSSWQGRGAIHHSICESCFRQSKC